MENNKLDKLFRDKLKDVKVSPPEGIWEAIAEELPVRRKSRVATLWWSAAAVLLALIGSSAFFWFISNPDSQNIQLVETDRQIEILIEENQENLVKVKETKFDEAKIKVIEKDIKSIKNSISSESDFSESKALVDDYFKEKTIVNQEIKGNESIYDLSGNEFIAKELNNENVKDGKEILLVKTEESTNKDSNLEQLIQGKLSETENKNLKQEVLSLVDNEKYAFEEVVNSKSEVRRKWSVGPQVAPVYYNSISGGSSLDSQFKDSGKEGGLNMSFGMQVAYQVNDNWQLRSGINKMDVGYATKNVHVGYSDPNLAIYNVNYSNVNDNGIVFTAFSNANLSNIQNSDLESRVELLYMEANSQLKQNISYLEIPIEIERKIINTDFEWSIIGGVSSLFLTNNVIYVDNKENRSHIGSASNLNKTSFTTNIGMGFGYNFTKQIHLQLEPMFKYQLNAYTNSVDFKPYIFGVYTGVRWRLD